MATTDAEKDAINDRERRRDQWLARLSGLVDAVDGWARELGWSTRRIEKRMEDSQLGTYEAPALLMQEGVIRVLLEPVAQSAPGVEGIVDLYLMPAFDDIATLYFYEGDWHLHHTPPGSGSTPSAHEAEPRPLSKDAFRETLEEMTKDAA